MFSPRVRWLLVFFSAGLGFYMFSTSAWSGGLLLISSLFLGAGHFLYGSVRASFVALQQGNLQRAAYLHSRTPVRFLTRESRAYYHWISAALAEARHDVDRACAEMKRALDFPLRTKRDQVLGMCTLAALCLHAGEIHEAKRHIDHAESLQPDPPLQDLLARLKAKWDAVIFVHGVIWLVRFALR